MDDSTRKNKISRIEQALNKGKKLYDNLAQKNQGKWLKDTIQLLETYLTLLPKRKESLEEVSDDYIFQVWETRESDSRLRELIAQVETRYEELLKIQS